MKLEFTIENTITFSNALEIYGQIICCESKLSKILGFRAYSFFADSDNYKLESNLPHEYGKYIISNSLMSSLLPLPEPNQRNLRFHMQLSNIYWESLILRKFKSIPYESVFPLSLEELLQEPINSFSMAQHFIIKLPFAIDRRIEAEKNGNSYSVSLSGYAKELVWMGNKLLKIVSPSEL